VGDAKAGQERATGRTNLLAGKLAELTPWGNSVPRATKAESLVLETTLDHAKERSARMAAGRQGGGGGAKGKKRDGEHGRDFHLDGIIGAGMSAPQSAFIGLRKVANLHSGFRTQARRREGGSDLQRTNQHLLGVKGKKGGSRSVEKTGNNAA